MKSYSKIRSLGWGVEKQKMLKMPIKRWLNWRALNKAHIRKFILRINEKENWKFGINFGKREVKGEH